MQRRARQPKPTWAAWLVSVAALCLLLAGYVIAANLLVGGDIPATDGEAGRRDTIYFTIHAAGMLVALIAGFAVGKWINGLGVAFGLLFFIVMATSMTMGQVVAYEAACHGQNDVIRHWTC